MSTKLQLCKAYLKTGRSLSPVEAMANGMGMRLADLIYRLRKEENLPIVTEIRENPSTGEKYARYRLVQVGDRIRITNEGRESVRYAGGRYYSIGDEGVITKIPSSYVSNYQVEFDVERQGNRKWWVSTGDFEVIS